MITKTPNTRKKFRRAKRQMQALKALESIVPNKQVGKWADLRKMMAKGKSNDQHTGASALVGIKTSDRQTDGQTQTINK